MGGGLLLHILCYTIVCEISGVKYHDEAVAPLRLNWCDKIENLYTRKTIISNDNDGNDCNDDGDDGGAVVV